MATSSIFANFELKDPKTVDVFVDALCSDDPWPQPKATVVAEHITDPKDIRAFFARGPYAKFLKRELV